MQVTVRGFTRKFPNYRTGRIPSMQCGLLEPGLSIPYAPFNQKQ
jgi:hypothetical protein